jgi:hypothetical protein
MRDEQLTAVQVAPGTICSEAVATEASKPTIETIVERILLGSKYQPRTQLSIPQTFIEVVHNIYKPISSDWRDIGIPVWWGDAMLSPRLH